MAITIVFPEREGGAVVDIQTAVEGAQAAQAAAETAQAAAEAAAEDASWPTPTAWLTATAYSAAAPSADLVTQGGSLYVCLVSHTSGTFATDLAASKWRLVVTGGTDGEDGWSPVFGVTGASLEKTLTITDWTGGTGTKPSTGSVGVIVADASLTAITDQQTASVAAVVTAGDTQVTRVGSTPGSDTYVDTTAGLAATASGGFFNVVGTGNALATLYKDNAGVAESIGSWPTLSYVSGFAGLPTYLVDLLVTQSIGATATPVTGTNVGNFTIVFGEAITYSGGLSSLAFWALATGTLKVRRFTKSGTTFTQVGSDLSVTVSATGLNTKTPIDYGNFAVSEGEYLGFYGSGIIPYTGSGISYHAGSGDVTSFTGSAQTNRNYQIAFEVTGAVNPDAIDAVEAAISEVVVQKIGRQVTPTDGTAAVNKTLVFNEAATETSQLGRVRLWAETAGTVNLSVWTKSGNDFTKAREADVVVAVGLNEFSAEEGDFAALTVNAGEYVGYYSNSLVSVTVATGDSGGYFEASGDSDAFTDASAVTSTRLEISFDLLKISTVNQNRLDSIRSRLAVLEDTTLPTPTEWVMFAVAPAQSNGQGQGESNAVTPQAGTAYEWNGSALVALADPTSTEIGSGGSAWPAFCTEYTRRTGKGVIIVNCGVSGTTLTTDWAAAGARRAATMTAINGAKTAADGLGLAWQFGGLFAVIGEGDAGLINASSTTIGAVTTAWNSAITYFRGQLGAYTPVFVSQTGTLVSPSGSSTVADTTGYQQIRAAQKEWAQADARVYLAWTGAYNGAGRGLIKDTVHYETALLNEMGFSFAVCAAAHFGEGA